MISLFLLFNFDFFPDLQWKLRSELSTKTDLVQCICCQILAFCCWVYTWWSLLTNRSLWHTEKRRLDIFNCRNCSVCKEYSFLPSCGTFLPSHHWKDIFPFCNNISSWTIIFFILFKNLVKIQSLQVIHCMSYSLLTPCH